MTQLSEIDEMTQTVSDLHKDVYYHRPGAGFWAQWDAADDNGKRKIWDGLIESLEWENARAARENDYIVSQFEANVTATIEAGAGDRKTALRWMFQEYKTDYSMDLEHAIHEQNLMFVGNYEKEIKEAVGA